jgi:hypothetical protein
MPTQNGIKTLLGKLKQQLTGNQERPPTVFNEAATNLVSEEYVGPPLEIGNEY